LGDELILAMDCLTSMACPARTRAGVSTGVKCGGCSMMEYLLSPVQKAVHEAGREM